MRRRIEEVDVSHVIESSEHPGTSRNRVGGGGPSTRLRPLKQAWYSASSSRTMFVKPKMVDHGRWEEIRQK
jgi:hypothetical protein